MNKQSLPKIGIRPTIDNRRLGVRESLEAQTMDLAKITAEFLEKHLRHPSGEAVACVIAGTCIGGMAEAAACEEQFKVANVGLSITVTPCWCYGTETIDMDPLRPKAIWGFNGTERPGAVYLAAALAGHNQKGLPAFSMYSCASCAPDWWSRTSGANAISPWVASRWVLQARSSIMVSSSPGWE